MVKLAVIMPSLAAPTRQLRYVKEQITALRCVFPNVPIIILAQDWAENGWSLDYPNVSIYHTTKMGITPARQELREIALSLDYDYYMMTDDDVLWGLSCGDKYAPAVLAEAGQRVMHILETHPDGFGSVQPCFLKGFFISHYLFSRVMYAHLDTNGANGYDLGFEDFSFAAECILRFPERRFDLLDTGFCDLTPAHRDGSDSTWWTEDMNKNPGRTELMYRNTLTYLSQFPDFKWLRDSDIMLKGSQYSRSIVYDFLNSNSLNALKKYYFDSEESGYK